MLHLLVKTQAEVNVLRNFVASYIVGKTGANPEKITQKLKTEVNQQIDLIVAQVKAHYESGFDVDDFLDNFL